MGTCISKCIPNKKSKQPKSEDVHHDLPREPSHVQDKLVIISQNPKEIPLLIHPNKLVISDFPRTPPSPSLSTTSSSFISCATSKSSIGSSSTLTSSSSSSASFSNEFLRACYKENSHISRINSLKETSKYYSHKNIITNPTKPKQSCPQKRVRPVSPSPKFTRQKSFRRDDHEPGQRLSRDSYYMNRSTVRSSPSPSRRFVSGGEKESLSKCVMASSEVIGSDRSRSLVARPWLSVREQRNVHRVGSKIDEIAVAEALVGPEIDNVSMEDIDNPLISLDCFIFI